MPVAPATMLDVVMPKLSDVMEEGTVLRWLVDDGETVQAGADLVEIETDKATVTTTSDVPGMVRLLAREGETVAVDVVIAQIEVTASSGKPTTTREPVGTQTPVSSAVTVSPVARRLAQQLGIDLRQVHGTGPGGRVVKGDVERFQPEDVVPPRSATPIPAAPARPITDGASGVAKGNHKVQDLTRIQQVIARRMAEAKATIPDFALQVTADVTDLLALRTALRELPTSPDPLPSVNDMIVRAAALALRAFPRANGAFVDGRFELHDRVNVGFAVAAEDSLLVPTVRNADAKGLLELARETRGLSEKARAGSLTPAELAGGTFTVSNLGMFQITSFTAVVTPKQAAILAVGGAEARPVVRDGQIVVRECLDLTLVSDHRILYGADAARFLSHIRKLLEHPLALTL